jgi:hypothetical protein
MSNKADYIELVNELKTIPEKCTKFDTKIFVENQKKIVYEVSVTRDNKVFRFDESLTVIVRYVFKNFQGKF